jgi:hypothetical protein
MAAIDRFATGSCSSEHLRLLGGKRKGFGVTIIEIRPHRGRWKVFEISGVEPVFLNQQDAIDYATGRAGFRSGEIRILNSRGAVERTMPFSEADRTL